MQMRVDTGKAGLNALIMCSCVSVVSVLAGGDMKNAGNSFSGERLALMLVYSSFLLASASSDRLTPRIIDGMYVWIMLVFLFGTLPVYGQSGTTRVFTFTHAFTFIGRFYLADWVMNLRLSAGCNALFTIYNCYQTISIVESPTGCSLATSDGDIIIREVLLFAVMVVYLRKLERRAVAESSFLMAIQRSHNERDAKTSLLDAVCDVVVALDTDFRITESSPKLACMLLYHEGTQSLKGDNMLRFLAAQDHERFSEFVKRPLNLQADQNTRGGYSIAEIIHARMRDSMGSSIEVEIIHSLFLEPDSRVGHLIGIREVSSDGLDRWQQRTLREEAPPMVNSNSPRATIQSDESSSSGGFERAVHVQVPDEDISVTFDAVTYDVSELTPALTNLYGQSFNSVLQFASCMREGAQFIQWLQDAVQAYAYDEPLPLAFREVTLRPPYASFANVEYCATFSLEFFTASERTVDNAEDGAIFVRMSLSNIHVRPWERRGTSHAHRKRARHIGASGKHEQVQGLASGLGEMTLPSNVYGQTSLVTDAIAGLGPEVNAEPDCVRLSM